MAGLGWQPPFRPRPWAEVRAFVGAAWGEHNGGAYLVEIIDSVTDRGADEVLAVTTSMHDLLVTLRPVAEAPVDVVAVRAPNSMRSARPGMVRIEYLGGTGRDTLVERPPGEAVPLFWRFLREEFGIASTDNVP